MAVLFLLAGRLLAMALNGGLHRVRLPNPVSPLYVNYFGYFVLGMLAGVVGYFSSTYSTPYPYLAEPEVSAFSRLLNSPHVRPIFEYVIALYYFCYFLVLPRYLLSERAALEHFLSLFKIIFAFSLVAGFISFALSFADIGLIPRHLADSRLVPHRFHAFAGEPRDAFVYLFYGLATLHLYALYQGIRLSRWWVVATVLAALFTQSASGVLGIIFFLCLYAIYALVQLRAKTVLGLLGIAIAVTLVVVVVLGVSERIASYVEAASGLWALLESGDELPYLMAVQSSNIYPLYDLTVKVRQLDLLPVLIGSGFGSASAINNVYMPLAAEMSNPYSQLSRVLFESGLIGAALFVLAFVRPVQYCTRRLAPKKRREFMLLTLLVIGCVLAHRSAVAFIYVGTVIAVFRVIGEKEKRFLQTTGLAVEGERRR